jgi:hypothetical protein
MGSITTPRSCGIEGPRRFALGAILVGAPGNGKAARLPGTEDLPLQSPSPSDYLGLLRGDLVEHLRRARAALEPAGSRAVSDLGAAVCAAEIGQTVAVLRPLGLELLGMLAEDLGRLAASLEERTEARRANTTELLRQGIDQLRDGIERRAMGRPEGAWAVLAVLNELRAALGMPLVSQARLFAPDLERDIAGLRAESGLAHPEFAEAARGERIVLHRAMYLWYSGREPERALRKLRRVAQTMRRVAGNALVQRLFLVLEAVVVAAAEQDGPPTQALRRVLLQVDGLLKAGAEGGETAVATNLPVSVWRNLLFQVGSSGSTHRIVQAVRRSMDLQLLHGTGCDGREMLAPLLRSELASVQGLLDGQAAASGGALAALAEAVRGLSDSLGLAQVGELRQRLDAPLAALSRQPADERAAQDALAALQAALVAIDAALRGGAFAPDGEGPEVAMPPAGGATDVAAAASDSWAETEPMQAPVTLESVARNDEAEDVLAESGRSSPPVEPPFAVADGAAPELPAEVAEQGSAEAPAMLEVLDEDIREVFLDEASERVAALRDAYVTWSAQPDDEPSVAEVLRLLGDLKSTGRLVGAHTLSEVCWVLQAALARCRDGALPATEGVLAVLDQGVEAVDSLVVAHVSGAPVAGDPRAVERSLYGLLAADPDALERLAAPGLSAGARAARRGGGEIGQDTEDLLATSDLGIADILADEAEDLVEVLAEGLEGMLSGSGTGWVLEMRRGLRSLAATARYAQSSQLAGLCDVFEAALATAAGASGVPDAAAQQLVEDALDALRRVVAALRDGRAPAISSELVERLRRGEADAAGVAAAGEVPPAGAAPGIPERSSRALEEQVVALRDYVAQLEEIVARLARVPQRSGADVADRARALADLGPCADGLHEASLAIDALVRGAPPR